MDLGAYLRLDPESGQPPYEQIRRGVLALIDDGVLLVGSRIPTVRALAADLDVAPNTVARSYRELESAGVLETRGRSGSFIKSGPDATLASAQYATVEHVNNLRQLGISDDKIVELVTQAVRSR
ncbi:GntR family transcriptional regulator [Gordonia sp. NPDC003376]